MPADALASQSLIRDHEHAVSLPAFEGPLDLLLFLIRKNEVDIYDIPIERITRQYLEILRSIELPSLEAAGDFFVMAATLMQIKSRMLLPKDDRALQAIAEEDDESGIDPRWELVQQLIEYRKFKDVSSRLNVLIDHAQNILFRDIGKQAEQVPERPLQPSDALALWNVFNHVLRRLAEKIIVGEIHEETVTVATCMEHILELLRVRRQFHFSELLADGASLAFAISSFLAILELTRLKRIELQQDLPFADILCTPVKEQ